MDVLKLDYLNDLLLYMILTGDRLSVYFSKDIALHFIYDDISNNKVG